MVSTGWKQPPHSFCSGLAARGDESSEKRLPGMGVGLCTHHLSQAELLPAGRMLFSHWRDNSAAAGADQDSCACWGWGRSKKGVSVLQTSSSLKLQRYILQRCAHSLHVLRAKKASSEPCFPCSAAAMFGLARSSSISAIRKSGSSGP